MPCSSHSSARRLPLDPGEVDTVEAVGDVESGGVDDRVHRPLRPVPRDDAVRATSAMPSVITTDFGEISAG